MLFVVDGTGPASREEYDREMANGFCRRLQDQAGGRYWRGPTVLGHETVGIAEEVVAAVLEARQGPRAAEALFLAGHSRGGAAVIFAAQELRRHKVAVEAMFLYDAVDRTFNNRRDADVVPGNVRLCYHAMRDTSLAFYYSDGLAAARDRLAACMGLPSGRRPSTMEDLIDLAIAGPVKPGPCEQQVRRVKELTEQDYKMKLVMRSVTMQTPDGWTLDFGNCGTRPESGCRLLTKEFLGSHGAIGGAPITDGRAPRLLIDSDRAAMASVDAWMSGHLARHGLFQKAR